MPIQGLISPEVSAAPAVDVNVSDRAALAMEALRILGRVGADADETLESIRKDFGTLGQEAGETYVQLPFGSGFTPLNMLQAMDRARYPFILVYPDQHTYPDTSRDLWLPQSSKYRGYSLAEINRLDVVAPGKAEPAVRPAHARLALTSGPRSEEPLLHLLDMPYDKTTSTKWRQLTQLDQLAAKKTQFDAAHPNLELNAINLAGFAMIALQRRIEGKVMPASWGFMIVPQPGRLTLDRRTLVSRVYSYGGQLKLDLSPGKANPFGGVGFSVGLNESLTSKI